MSACEPQLTDGRYIASLVPEGSNLTDVAVEFTEEIRDLWNAGQPARKPSTYVN